MPTAGINEKSKTAAALYVQLEKEVEYLDDTNSKFVVDNESLNRRHDQMSARKTELEKSLRERR